MYDLTKTIWYKNNSIDYDDSGYWTVFYCGDDVMFNTVQDAKDFIDEISKEDELDDERKDPLDLIKSQVICDLGIEEDSDEYWEIMDI